MSDTPRLVADLDEAPRTHIPGRAGVKLTRLLRDANAPLNTRCSGKGLCDGCRVRLGAGAIVEIDSGRILRDDDADGEVKACLYRLPTTDELDAAGIAVDEVRLAVPARSRLMHRPQVVSRFRIGVPFTSDPLIRVVPVEGVDPAGWSQRVAETIGDGRTVNLAAEIASETADWLLVTGDAAGWRVLSAGRGVPPEPLAIAVDIGTTTVAAMLVDAGANRVLAQASAFNAQVELGDNVLTRINSCSVDPASLGKLHDAIIQGTLVPLVRELRRSDAAGGRPVTGVCVCANTTMLHLLAHVDPTSMGVAPFTAAFLDHRLLDATAPRWSEFAQALVEPVEGSAGASVASGFEPVVHLAPGAGAYVGADLTAGLAATGMVYDDGPSLLVDVGTNGEIILKHGRTLLGCATAAGPAFEGSGLSAGVRAADGAISHVEFSASPFQLTTEVIGGGAAHGVCGSAYIDFLGEARRVGLLNDQGRLDDDGLATLGEGAQAAIVKVPGYGRGVRLARTDAGEDVAITEVDVSALLQAKAAIAAGILTLLARVDMAPGDIRTLYLAGGFGMHVRVKSAIASGLLPGFRPEQIQVVGNTSLAGAYLSLIDRGVLDEITRAAAAVELVELNQEPDFEMCYIEQLMLPAPVRPS